MKRKIMTILMSMALCLTVSQGVFATAEMPAEIPIDAEYPESLTEEACEAVEYPGEECLENVENPVYPEDESFDKADDPMDADVQDLFENPESGITGQDAPQISESFPDEELVGAAQSYTFTVNYGQTEARSMLSMVNSFRTGSDAWYWAENNTTKKYCKGLSKLTYDYQLEKVAMLRAVEVAISFGHTRPDSTVCFTAYNEQGYTSYGYAGENIAVGKVTAKEAYTTWREDNDKYSGQGHRRTMLSADFNRIGIGHVVYGGVHYWVQEFASSNSTITKTDAKDSSASVNVRIDDKNITSLKIQSYASSIELTENESKALPTVSISLSVSGHRGNALSAKARCNWSVSNTSIAKISGNNLLGVSQGSTSLKTTVNGKNITIPVTVKPWKGFSDVQDQSHPYYKAIYWAANAGITKGYSDGTFGIDKSCTRGEMMMFLWRYTGKPEPKSVSASPFKDVPKSHTFYKAILWGSQKGITKGYPDGNFGIDRNVSRGECMMFLWRVKGKPAPKSVSASPFKDVPKNHAFYNAILWGSQKHITNGYTTGPNAGNFGINDDCTRGQIVTFLYRAK